MPDSPPWRRGARCSVSFRGRQHCRSASTPPRCGMPRLPAWKRHQRAARARRRQCLEHALCSGVAHAPPHPRRGAPRGLNRSLRVFRSRGGAAEGHGGRLEGRWGRALNRAARQPAACAAHRSALGRVHGRALARMHAWSPISLEPAASSEHRTLQNTRWHGISALPSRVHMHAPTLGARALHGAARASTAGGRAAVDGRLARDRASGAKGARPQSNFAKFLLPIYSISLSPNHLAAQIMTD